jgi:hypothetical protein
VPDQQRTPDLDRRGLGWFLADVSAGEQVGLRIDEKPLRRVGGGGPMAFGQGVHHLAQRRSER